MSSLISAVGRLLGGLLAIILMQPQNISSSQLKESPDEKANNESQEHNLKFHSSSTAKGALKQVAVEVIRIITLQPAARAKRKP